MNDKPKYNLRNLLLLLGIIVAIVIGATYLVFDQQPDMKDQNKEFIEKAQKSKNSENEIKTVFPDQYIDKIKNVLSKLTEL